MCPQCETENEGLAFLHAGLSGNWSPGTPVLRRNVLVYHHSIPSSGLNVLVYSSFRILPENSSRSQTGKANRKQFQEGTLAARNREYQRVRARGWSRWRPHKIDPSNILDLVASSNGRIISTLCHAASRRTSAELRWSNASSPHITWLSRVVYFVDIPAPRCGARPHAAPARVIMFRRNGPRLQRLY